MRFKHRNRSLVRLEAAIGLGIRRPFCPFYFKPNSNLPRHHLPYVSDTELLLENVFQELNSCYLNALCTKESSLLLETLLAHADAAWVLRFTFDLVGHSWPDLLQNPYASRVFDCCLQSVARSNAGTGIEISILLSKRIPLHKTPVFKA